MSEENKTNTENTAVYYSAWENIFSDRANQEAVNLYYELETEAYKKILSEKRNLLEGDFEDLARELGFGGNEYIFVGFVEGMLGAVKGLLNPEAQNVPADQLKEAAGEMKADNQIYLKKIEIGSNPKLKIDIDFEKLFFEMRRAKAPWLYDLKEWDEIISPEERRELVMKLHEASRAKSNKVGRNEPCPCGSGKKYKQCCGRKV